MGNEGVGKKGSVGSKEQERKIRRYEEGEGGKLMEKMEAVKGGEGERVNEGKGKRRCAKTPGTTAGELLQLSPSLAAQLLAMDLHQVTFTVLVMYRNCLALTNFIDCEPVMCC